MIKHMTYKFRLNANERHKAMFRRFAGCRRYIYNRALAEQERRYANGEKHLSVFDLTKLLTVWRRDQATPWLAEIPVYFQRGALKDLDRAYVNFFEKRANRPTFKKKGKCRDSFGSHDLQTFQIDAINGRIRLPKIGWVRYRNSRLAVGKPRTVCVSRDGDHWFISITVEQITPEPVHPNPTSTVGIDVGVTNFATMSNGTSIQPLNAFRGIKSRLARQQRKLARQVKFSNRWKKQKERIGKLHRKAKNQRLDFLHKFTTTVSKNHATVVVEELQIANISKSAKGTEETPGTNVAQKSGLNRSIQDQGWGECFRQLGYKTTWTGGKLVKVTAPYTSQTCNKCGHCCAENRTTQSFFLCVVCGHTDNADVNAAKNILARGLKELAVGQTVTVRGGDRIADPVKRKPAGGE